MNSAPRPTYPELDTDTEGCRALILAMIHRAIDDFLYQPTLGSTGSDKLIRYESAKSFLFNDYHLIPWGGHVYKPRCFFSLADIEIDYLRDKIKQRIGKERVSRRAPLLNETK